jgi:PhoPQ-activated pathogenicity-related protein
MKLNILQTNVSWRVALFFTLLVSMAPVSFAQKKQASSLTALDRYVAAPDANYKYSLEKTIPGKGYTTYVLEMISQAWRSAKEVDRTLWKHWVVITKPDEVTSSRSLLFVGGGSNDKPAPKSADEGLIRMALATKTVVSEVRMIPNQPLTFAGETTSRKEDEMIAYTWDKFMTTGDALWPARLPMTKAVVRAMDTVTSFCASEAGGKLQVDRFVVSGGSKRGWTTWTTAAVDKRVIAIAPIVIDLLNLEPSFRHHYAAYGFYAPSVGDYVQMGIMERQGTPQYRALMKIEEPFEYRDRLTLPKFIINATGDQFFLPDSWRFYYSELKGEKRLRYVPNADHGLKGTDALFSLMAFYHSVVNDKPMPQYTWNMDKSGTLHVQTNDKPMEVKLWQATNPEARDFRLETFGAKWTSSVLPDKGNGMYSASVPMPEKGWTAWMIELTFPSGMNGTPLKFTTGVYVTPDTLPYQNKLQPIVKKKNVAGSNAAGKN